MKTTKKQIPGNGSTIKKEDVKIKQVDKKPAEEKTTKKKKGNSAMAAASVYKSPVDAKSSHSYAKGKVDETGIWSEFREEDGIG